MFHCQLLVQIAVFDIHGINLGAKTLKIGLNHIIVDSRYKGSGYKDICCNRL